MESEGRVHLANADANWAGLNGNALVAIHAQRRHIGLFALAGGGGLTRGTVPLDPHGFNTSCLITRELNLIGVDLRRVARTTVTVTRVRRSGCGTRYLVLRFTPASLKNRAVKNKHTHRDDAENAR